MIIFAAKPDSYMRKIDETDCNRLFLLLTR